MISSEEAHGDLWFARLRAEHDAAGDSCPCGNGSRNVLEAPEEDPEITRVTSL